MVGRGKPRAIGGPLWFIHNVALCHTGDACLIWPYKRSKGRGNGYGNIWYEGRWIGAHRLVCTLVNGPPPSEFHEAAHSCGGGLAGCVSPHHVRWATKKENAADSKLHGTHVHGEQHTNSKLTEADVIEIISLLGSMRQKDIAEQYGVAQTSISRIKRKATWAEVQPIKR